jgi:hypothetical protein
MGGHNEMILMQQLPVATRLLEARRRGQYLDGEPLSAVAPTGTFFHGSASLNGSAPALHALAFSAHPEQAHASVSHGPRLFGTVDRVSPPAAGSTRTERLIEDFARPLEDASAWNQW